MNSHSNPRSKQTSPITKSDRGTNPNPNQNQTQTGREGIQRVTFNPTPTWSPGPCARRGGGGLGTDSLGVAALGTGGPGVPLIQRRRVLPGHACDVGWRRRPTSGVGGVPSLLGLPLSQASGAGRGTSERRERKILGVESGA
jgi:hypothetical protein